jgi:hypothetical protein
MRPCARGRDMRPYARGRNAGATQGAGGWAATVEPSCAGHGNVFISRGQLQHTSGWRAPVRRRDRSGGGAAGGVRDPRRGGLDADLRAVRRRDISVFRARASAGVRLRHGAVGIPGRHTLLVAAGVDRRADAAEQPGFGRSAGLHAADPLAVRRVLHGRRAGRVPDGTAPGSVARRDRRGRVLRGLVRSDLLRAHRVDRGAGRPLHDPRGIPRRAGSVVAHPPTVHWWAVWPGVLPALSIRAWHPRGDAVALPAILARLALAAGGRPGGGRAGGGGAGRVDLGAAVSVDLAERAAQLDPGRQRRHGCRAGRILPVVSPGLVAPAASAGGFGGTRRRPHAGPGVRGGGDAAGAFAGAAQGGALHLPRHRRRPDPDWTGADRTSALSAYPSGPPVRGPGCDGDPAAQRRPVLVDRRRRSGPALAVRARQYTGLSGGAPGAGDVRSGGARRVVLGNRWLYVAASRCAVVLRGQRSRTETARDRPDAAPDRDAARTAGASARWGSSWRGDLPLLPHDRQTGECRAGVCAGGVFRRRRPAW